MSYEDTDICAADTADGSPCQLPAGSCPHHENQNGWPALLSERQSDIIDAARRGKTKKGCARSAGVGESTLYDWLDRFPEFSESFTRARAKGEDRLVDDVAESDPRFLLERSYGYTKTEKQEIDLTGDVDISGNVTADFVTYDEEDGDE